MRVILMDLVSLEKSCPLSNSLVYKTYICSITQLLKTLKLLLPNYLDF